MNKTIEINGTWFVLNFMDKDTDAEYVKWHNFTMNNMFNANDFYIVQIVQEKDCAPRGNEFCKMVLELRYQYLKLAKGKILERMGGNNNA